MTVIAELPWSSSRRNIEENYLSTDPQNPKIQREREKHQLNKRHLEHRLICTGRPLHPKHHHIPGLMSHSIHEASKETNFKREAVYSSEMLQKA